MENSIEKDEEILNNIKAYMQESIDKGYHKFVYNDLGYDEKCVDVINAIEYILSDYKRVIKENEEYSKQLDLDYVDKNYISKQKIKDEIEELKEKLEYISKRKEKSKTKKEEIVLWCLEIRTDERIKTLQELL